MKQETIENIINFLQRVELRGNEVPAYIECINSLWKLSEENNKPKE